MELLLCEHSVLFLQVSFLTTTLQRRCCYAHFRAVTIEAHRGYVTYLKSHSKEGMKMGSQSCLASKLVTLP
jgi:hypothetical protein